MKVLAIIQARLGSTRLPKKVLLPLGDKNILDYVYQRTRNIELIDQVVIATTNKENDDRLVEWCNDRNIDVYRGSEEDLLDRFYQCALLYKADYIVRVTSDCPYISYEMANFLIEETLRDKSDYGYINSKSIPIGLKVSIISTETLGKLCMEAQHPYYREHITLFMDENLEQFKVTKVKPLPSFLNRNYRLTIDTEEDYHFCKKIVDNLDADPLIKSERIIEFLLENSELTRINATVKQKIYQVKAD